MSRIGKEREPSKENLSGYKMVVLDVDGTLVKPSNFQEAYKAEVDAFSLVFNSLGIPDEHQRLKDKYMTGKRVKYEKWTTEACEVWKAKGLTEVKFLETMNKLSFMDGAKEFFAELKRLNYKTVVITGGLRYWAEKAKREFGIDYAVGHCGLKFKKGRLDDWDLLPCDSIGKVNFFLKIANEYGFRPAQCVGVGNGINDIPFLRRAGLSIAFNANNQRVRNVADVVVEGNDLRQILPSMSILFKKN